MHTQSSLAAKSAVSAHRFYARAVSLIASFLLQLKANFPVTHRMEVFHIIQSHII